MKNQNKTIQGANVVTQNTFFIQNTSNSDNFLHYVEFNPGQGKYEFKEGFKDAAVWRYKEASKFLQHTRLGACKIVLCRSVMNIKE